MTTTELLLRITIAFICGCAIGSERQIHHKIAGLKTNALVALGACAFTLFDLMNHLAYGSDLRVSAQIVSGIGFIGGGVILKDGFNIRGLTTAATLWCSAAAGMLAGMDYLWEAAIISLFVMIINTFLRSVVSLLNNVSSEEDEYLVRVFCEVGQEDKVKKVVLEYIENKKLILKDIRIRKGVATKQDTVIDSIILSKKDRSVESISHKIAQDTKINGVTWEIIKA